MSQLPKSKTEKRVSPAANVLLTVILLIAVAVMAYYAYFVPQPPKIMSKIPFLKPNETAIRETAVSSLDEKYRLKTIQYFDQNYSFTIRYPLGYSAVVDPVPDIRLRFSAYYPPYSAEIFDLIVVDKDVLDAEKIRVSAVSANTTVVEYSQDGKNLFIMSLKKPDLAVENETVFVTEAFYDCPTYWLIYAAAVSAPLAPDLELADYMISTMRCG